MNFDLVVIANRYPGGRSYGGEFIHSRLKHYIEHFNIVVIDMGKNQKKINEDSYQGVKVIRASYRLLGEALKKYPAKMALIHSPQEAVFDSVYAVYPEEKIITWHHGAESLDLRCRYDFMARDCGYFAWQNVVDRQDVKLSFVKTLLENPNVKNIFVSNYLLNASQKDSGAKAQNFEIIHNNVGSEFFLDRDEDDFSKTNRVLILRDFSSTKAADVAVEVVNRLADHQFFENLEVNVYGFGQHWDAWVDPIRQYKNVNLFEGYLEHSDIPAILAKHDILIVPTRHDTQSLVMCEGMAAGLYCIANNVAAIPEFLDNTSGLLARTLDGGAIAEELVERIAKGPLNSVRKNAVSRMRNQCGFESTIGREVELLKQY